MREANVDSITRDNGFKIFKEKSNQSSPPDQISLAIELPMPGTVCQPTLYKLQA